MCSNAFSFVLLQIKTSFGIIISNTTTPYTKKKKIILLPILSYKKNRSPTYTQLLTEPFKHYYNKL